MAPGLDGSLYVSIPKSGGSVLALLDHDGRPRSGWPITIVGTTHCQLLLPVDDGSVRAVCSLAIRSGSDVPATGAFAFDADGRSLAGWPVDLGDDFAGYVAGRIIGDELTFVRLQSVMRVVMIAADGTVRDGVQVTLEGDCCDDTWAIGPDGVAYGTINHFGDTPQSPKTAKLVAIGLTGTRPGFPVSMDGMVSRPAFDDAGQIHVTVVPAVNGTARTRVFDPRGRAVGGASKDLGIRATDVCVGIEGSCSVPAAPFVAPDGTTLVVEAAFNRTAATRISPSGAVMAGWPYRSEATHQAAGFCPTGSVCEGYGVAIPTSGPEHALYLIHAAATKDVGGSIVAVGPDGRVRTGWPVELKRPGSMFWSVVAGPDRTLYALAVEPESGGRYSATIIGIAPDSTVRYSTTIIEP